MKAGLREQGGVVFEEWWKRGDEGVYKNTMGMTCWVHGKAQDFVETGEFARDFPSRSCGRRDGNRKEKKEQERRRGESDRAE